MYKRQGLEFKRDGWLAGVTWFRNDYRNKIEAGYAPVYQNNKGTDLYPVSYTHLDVYKRQR